ncbi:MAG: AsnC family transcriptional regulator [Promethearchaeota archaeon]
MDDIDKQIFRLLFKDGRMSLTDLAKNIVKSNQEIMSHTGIKKRLKKMQDSSVLKIQGNLNIKNLNYKCMFILLEMKNYESQMKIVKAYSECPRVFLLANVSGQFNIIMGIIGQNIDVLHQYINYCGPTNKEGILHSEILFVSDLRVPEFLPINLFSNTSQEDKCGNICKNCEAFLDGKCNGCGKF